MHQVQLEIHLEKEEGMHHLNPEGVQKVPLRVQQVAQKENNQKKHDC